MRPVMRVLHYMLLLPFFRASGCIIYSTLATRQHVAVDAWAGLALAGLAAYLSLHHYIHIDSADKVHPQAI